MPSAMQELEAFSRQQELEHLRQVRERRERDKPAERPNLSPAVSLTPADKLSPGDRLKSGAYMLADGTAVDTRYVRAQNLAQDGHTSSEHLVYQTLWRAGGGDSSADVPYRDVAIGQAAISRQASISKRNLIRILESLHEKFSIETLRGEVSSDHTTKTYRVWSMKEILGRRRAGGFCWIYRNRNVVALARSGANLSPGDSLSAGVSLSSAPGVSLSSAPGVSLTPLLGSSLGNKKELSSSASPVVVAALRAIDAGTDDDGATQIITAARRACPDATDEEIAHFIRVKGRGSGIKQPLAFLRTAVPKCFKGESLRQFRLDAQQAREAQEQRDRQQREYWRAVLENPNSSEEERNWARDALSIPAP